MDATRIMTPSQPESSSLPSTEAQAAPRPHRTRIKLCGLANAAAYSATKGAMASMTRAWAAEFSPAGVRVNTVAPGPVHTAIQPADEADALGATTPMSRAAQPGEIAEVIAFLASPKASYITGAVLAADGGRTAV